MPNFERTAFFNNLVAIKDAINQQIPLAGNRFEAFDCPPLDANKSDVDIQKNMHESFRELFSIQCLAMEEMMALYDDFIAQHHLPANTALTDEHRRQLKQQLTSKMQALYVKLERLWHLEKPVNVSRFEAIKTTLFETMLTKLSDLCEYGPQALVIDEDAFIETYIQSLDQTDEANRDHLTAFARLLRTRQHTYTERYNIAIRLSELRTQFERNFLALRLAHISKSDLFTQDDGTDTKPLETLIKSQLLLSGSYLTLHQSNVGFCDEHARLGLIRLLEQLINVSHRIEKVSISYKEGDGHTFIVIDRNKNSELNDINTWGDDAIIFDAWHQIVCYTKDFYHLDKQYHFSFPKNAQWTTLRFSKRDHLLLSQLRAVNHSFSVAGNSDPETLETRLIEEYELIPIAAECSLNAYLTEVVQQYRPAHFKQAVHFYLTDHGCDLVKFIPGFRTPTIVIHKAVLRKLIDNQLSLSAFEFSIVALLHQFNVLTSYISPNAISQESQHQIDSQAMQAVGSSDACIEYFRVAAEFFNASDTTERRAKHDENILAGLANLFTTPLTFTQRIKLIQASIAAGNVRLYSDEPRYLSESFRHSLTKEGYTTPTASPHYFIIDAGAPNLSDSEKRIVVLKQLMSQLQILNIELLPYEESESPSIRLRQFANIIASLKIDYDNPDESNLVDELINKADALKIPGFEYLYCAFANRFGTCKQSDSIFLTYKEQPKDFKNRNRYYLIKEIGKKVDLYYVNQHGIKIPVNSDEIPELRVMLEQIASSKSLYVDIFDDDYDNEGRNKFEYYLRQHQALRPLGFFKDIQTTITAFTQAKSFEEAVESANAFMLLKKQYERHLADEEVHLRKTHANTSVNHANHRFYGSDLGKRIKWVGFDFSKPDNVTLLRSFPAFAARDQSGVIAEMLFRLGLSNRTEVINALTRKTLDRFAKQTIRNRVLHIGYLPLNYYDWSQTYYSALPRARDEQAARNHRLVHKKVFADKSLSFEEAFIRFYDANLPVLINPSLAYNYNTQAQRMLLKTFFEKANDGTTAEKNTVRSFFFGREDQRDLHHLLDLKSNATKLSKKSPYTQFMCFQQFGTRTHHLFEHDSPDSIYQLNLFACFDALSPFLLNEYCLLFRLPAQKSIDDALTLLLHACETQQVNFSKHIISAYFHEHTSIVLFSPLLTRVLSTEQTLSTEACHKLNNASWPPLAKHQLSALSIDELLLYYGLFDLYAIFPAHEIKAQFGQLIFRRIKALATTEEQMLSLETWLFVGVNKKSPISDIPLKNDLIRELIALYVAHYGKDNTPDYFPRLKPLLFKLIQNLFSRDKIFFMSQLLTALEAQRAVCEFVGLAIDPTDFAAFRSKPNKQSQKALLALIRMADFFSENETDKQALLHYLSSPFTLKNCYTLRDHIKKHLNFKRLLKTSDNLLDANNTLDPMQINEKLAAALISLYHQFWDRSLQERSVMIEQLIIPASKTISNESQEEAYEAGLAFIGKKLFPNADNHGSEDYLALCIMQSYLKTADSYIRSYLLTAMLVAANEQTGVQSSIGKRLVTVCEHMGPAYVKLVQAIHSHPDTSEAIRADLAHIKGRANPPHRWSLLRQLAEVVQPQDLARIKQVGPLLGSASYNLALEVTLENDETAVLLMLRENAQTTARKGFAHIRETIHHCNHPTIVRHRLMMEQTIDEAARLSENEMIKEASDAQSHLAEILYPNHMQFFLNKRAIHITIDTAHILSSDLGYRLITRMHGIEFNDLPSNTPKEQFIKRAIAQAVLTMELQNILRGGQFDSDRHGNQLRVEVKKVGRKHIRLHLGLYDFGEMSLTTPTQAELHQLADILKHMQTLQFWGKNLDEIIANRIESAVHENESTHFLMRLRKAFLALHDFQTYLTRADFLAILTFVAGQPNIHPILRSPLQQLTNPLYTLANELYTKLATFSLFSTQTPSPTPHQTSHAKRKNQ